MGKVFEILYLEGEKLFSVEPLPMNLWNWLKKNLEFENYFIKFLFKFIYFFIIFLSF